MKTGIVSMVLAALFMFAPAGYVVDSAQAREYQALKGVKEVSAIFDFRMDNPQSALDHLQLVHATYKDKALHAITAKPKFVVVFMGPSVTVLSKNRDRFTAEEKKQLEEMDATLSAMAKDGIALEVCMVAVNYYKVDPQSIAPEIKQVDNGWIASIGYQQQGYSLVPAY